MEILTNSGKAFEADWLLDTTTRHGAQQLVIQLPGDTALDAVMTDLVGAAQITSGKKVYEGYSTLASIIYSSDRKAMRLTLERGD